jgi:hypothetical protein
VPSQSKMRKRCEWARHQNLELLFDSTSLKHE